MLFEQVYKDEKQRLVESYVYKDPLYEQWQGVSRIIAERKMTEPEILDLFSKIETGMTGAGSNRTMLGRGKDVTTKAFTSVKDALGSVMSSIQNSAPVQAVDVAYDKATDAVADLQGGQKTKVMQAIKGYRNLVKEYPKASGFAKAALVAIAGLATGGAGLPAIAGLTYALDSAIRGDKLSSVLGKGAGAAAVTWGGQQLAGALKGTGGADAAAATGDVSAQDSLGAGETVVSLDGAGAGASGAASMSGGTYTVLPGDQGGFIAQANGVSFPDLKAANPDILDWSKLKPGTELQLPPANTHSGSVWVGSEGNPVSAAPTGTATAATPAPASDQGYAMMRSPVTQYTMSGTSVAGMPVIPGQPLNPTQMAVADMAISMGNKLSPAVQAAYDMAKNAAAVRESVNFKTLPADKLFDHKLTVMTWALNESVGKPAGRSVHLTTTGVYTVFENVGRYARAVVKEADVGPGRPDLPDEYRPDMPSGSGGYDKSKKGIVGKGLDWLDKAAGKVGGALSKFGHQFTTKVTKDKLKMDWHQAGKPSDSDAIAAFLAKQGVPQGVISDVYGSMGIPMSASATAAAEPKADAAKGGAQISLPYYGINPATKKAWTADELQAKGGAGAASSASTASAAAPASAPAAAPGTAAPSATPADKAPAAEPATAAKAPAGKSFAMPQATSSTAGMPSKVTYGKGFEKKPATTQFPSFGTAGTAGGYATAPTATALPKPTTAKVSPAMPAAPAAPKAPGAPETVGTYDKKTGAAKLGGKSMIALKDLPAAAQKRVAAVAEHANRMLQNVKTKQDADDIRTFIDQQFAKHGLLESALPQRKQLMDHVNKVSAIRRRLHAKKQL